MASPSEKLAESLEKLRELQDAGRIAIESGKLSRTHRQRLVSNGFLMPVIKGWYIPARPDDSRGETTAWYAAFWPFVAAYLESRFGADWALSPEQSLLLHGANRAVPRQLIVRAPRAGNSSTTLPHGTSLLEVRAALPAATDRQLEEGLRLFSLESSLIHVSPACFTNHSTDVRAALGTIHDASGILAILLRGGHSTIAGRLAGAFRNVGRDQLADEIIQTMVAAGYDVRETDPFLDRLTGPTMAVQASPYVNRIRLLYQKLREPIIGRFPISPGLPWDRNVYLKSVDDTYVTDAYHSLSIEGYRVTASLVERVRSGGWNPDRDEHDRERRDAMAARGYFEAFQSVRESIGAVLSGRNPAEVARADHRRWYRELFAPSVAAGLLQPGELAGYRTGQVYIRDSMHVPPNRGAVLDLMPTFFDLLRDECDPAVRIVLGHFVFVYIHPYIDGNGRMGRFVMNLMMAAAGYPWTVIPVARRNEYLNALERASVGEDIGPFADFLAGLVRARLAGDPLPVPQTGASEADHRS